MTPMIDVVFLLLIFFVVASVGQIPDEILPASIMEGVTAEVEPVNPDPLIASPDIRIDLAREADELVIRLNQSVVSPAVLQQRLSQLVEIDPSSRIILGGADDVLVQHFMTVYERCQVLGFQKISFAVGANSAG